MKIIEVGSNGEQVLVGESYKRLSSYLPEGRVVMITDENLYNHYGHFIGQYENIVIPAGETAKSWQVVSSIVESLLDLNADRHTFLVGFGGGVVCDVTGFVASVFMRGIRFGFVSSSLLSQVDASVGGKNGINFANYKNILGCFSLPEFVICDVELLKTLPERELRNGFAELLKHAIIRDLCFFQQLVEKGCILLNVSDYVLWRKILHHSIQIKADVVKRDLYEVGERKILNFGHTFAHAIEKNSELLHGEAVAVGMAIAMRFSVYKGLLSRQEESEVIGLLELFSLPVSCDVNTEILYKYLKKDKKKKEDAIDFVFLERIGKARVIQISFEELFDFIKKELE